MISLRRMVIAVAIALGVLGSAGAAEPAKDAERAERERERGMKALRLAVEDLTATFGDRYPRGREYLERLSALSEGRGRDSLDSLRSEARCVADFNNDGELDIAAGKFGGSVLFESTLK